MAIVAFWLGTSAWFVAREIAPSWRGGDPPPYVIELADEARGNPPASWHLIRNGREIGTVRTGIRYHEMDDTFALTAESTRIEVLKEGAIPVSAQHFRSSLHVNRDGELRGVSMQVTLKIEEFEFKVDVSANVNGNRIERACCLESPLGKIEPALEPIPYVRGSVLSPLHPLNRMTGLRSGQRWRVPLVDPMGDAMKSALLAAIAKLFGQILPGTATIAAPNFLDVEVAAQPMELEWEHGSHSCLVIDYRGDDYSARTWVRATDGLVLRQEAKAHGEELILQRY